ncbi:hypothetical protein [Streptomyces sp. WAC 06783]|uniref:hypothetical protein n=1 Tax=Streptomyces sp. WAC 06783 TaxID=2203211 RepID=UPI0021AD81CB|nr:hypothetical protein [Streptomyces sp. WAC 06783]
MFRLVRGTGHILDVLDVLHRDQVALRIHDDAFSAMDLTARHPRTGELLSTVKFMVQTLAAVGELQRDLQRGLRTTGSGLPRRRAARAADALPWRPRRPKPCAPRTWRAAPSQPSHATTASAAAPSARPSPRPGLHPARQRHPGGTPPAPRPLPVPRRHSRHLGDPGTAQGPSRSSRGGFWLTLAGPRPGPRPSTSRRRWTRWTRRSSGRPNGRSWRRPPARRADAPDGNDAGYRGGNGA